MKKVKSIALIAILFLSGTTISFAQEKGKEKEENHHVGEPGMGPHKGTIQEADPYHAEIAMKDGKIMLYLLTDEAKMMSNAGVTCKATFLMHDGKTVKEIPVASGDDGFVVNNTDVMKYKSCVASFTVKGKTVTAKFKEMHPSKKMAMYVCPMHPKETSDKPGKCSKCGMDYVVKK